jgi:exosortase K
MTSPQTKPGWRTVAQAAVILIVAASLKAFYSTASVNELTWILWPTKTVVEAISGAQFHFEPYAGYMSEDRSFLIAAACSGVNFLIAIYMMLSLRALWRRRSDSISWPSLLLIAGLSYMITIVANSLRISSAMWLISTRREFFGMDRDELHRLDGILIYFGMMLIVYVAFEYFESKRRMLPLKSLAFPLAIYYTITLAVPIANGAFRDSEFLTHSLFVIATPLVLIAMFVVFGKLLFRDAQSESIAAAAPLFPGHLCVDKIRAGSNV